MKTKSPSNRTVQFALGAAIAVLLAVGAFSYRSMVVSSESDRWVGHTHGVLQNLDEMILAMETISSSIHGFALTGNETFIDTYHAGRASVEQRLASVRGLTADSPEQQSRILAAGTLAAESFERAEMTIGLRRAQGLEAAADAVRSDPGRQAAADFQSVSRELRDEELRLLSLREAAAKESLSRSTTILIAGTVLGLLITGAAGWSVQRFTALRDPAGTLLGYFEFSHDLSESKESSAKYRGLLEAAPDAMVVVDQGGEIVQLNVRAEKQFGYRRGELL
jgi:CHASE3 domain sensor protein